MSANGSSQKVAVAGVFDRAAAAYDEAGVDFFTPAGRDLVERAAPGPGDRVLDLGCGKGASALPAAERVGPEGTVLAVDLAPGMVAALQVRARSLGLRNLTAVVGDAEAPPVAEGGWDLVLSSLTLFFLPDLDAALARYRELLRPGGRLAFSWFGPDDQRWSRVYDALAADIPVEERSARRPGGSAFDSPASLAGALSAAGFSDVVTHEVTMDVPIRDGVTWWENQWAHGRRATMERLEVLGVLTRTRERVVEAVEALRENDGSLVWRPVIRHTLARS